MLLYQYFFSQREIGRAREKRMKFLVGISQNLENIQHSYSVVQICLKGLDNVLEDETFAEKLSTHVPYNWKRILPVIEKLIQISQKK